jgi:hypothetical protein
MVFLFSIIALIVKTPKVRYATLMCIYELLCVYMCVEQGLRTHVPPAHAISRTQKSDRGRERVRTRFPIVHARARE